jgi:hypothetical protein
MSGHSSGGTGFRSPHPVGPVIFTAPETYRPITVRIADDRVWAPPSATRVVVPQAGSWRNLVDTALNDLDAIQAIVARFGPLTAQGVVSGGEGLDVWWNLIDTLRQLAEGWTAEGEIAGPEATGAAWALAMRLQIGIGQSGTFVSYGAAGWGLVTPDMRSWWTLSAINDLYRCARLKRCRWCHSWFAPERPDAGFCLARHRSAFHQDRKPRSQYWAELI